MKKLMEKYGKKKVYGTIGGVIVVTIALIVSCMFVTNQKDLVLNDEAIVIELGDEVSLKPSAYLDKKVDKAIANDTVLKSDLITDKEKYTLDAEKQIVVTKDKEYLEVGKYDATLNYKKEVIKFEIEVKDTRAPSLEDTTTKSKEAKEDAHVVDTNGLNMVLEQNSEDVDYTKFFEFKDFSEFKVTVNDKKVDLGKIGDYELEVTAKDKYDNAVTKSVKVKVVSLEEAEKEDTVTKNLDGTVYQSKAMKEKVAEQQKVEEEKKAKEEQANANNGGVTNNGGSGSSSNSNGGGNTNSGGGNTNAPAQPNGIGAVINTAYSFVGRTDMSCSDVIKQSFSQNGYSVPNGLSFNIGYSVGSDTSVVQTGDMIITSNHIMLVVGVSGSSITVVEGGIDGNNVVVSNHAIHGTSIYRDGIAERQVLDIRRV